MHDENLQLHRFLLSVINFLWNSVRPSSSNLGQRAGCVQRDAGLWSPSARHQTTLIKVRRSVSGVWCAANSVWRYMCLPHASFPPSPPGVLLFWTCFNISWRAVCAAPPAPQHALNLHIFGGMQSWRSCRTTDTDAGVSVCVCVCVCVCACVCECVCVCGWRRWRTGCTSCAAVFRAGKLLHLFDSHDTLNTKTQIGL